MDRLPTEAQCVEAKKIIEDLATEWFKDVRVVRADVEADWDHDGDPVLWVRLVTDDSDGELSGPLERIRMKFELARLLEEAGIHADTVISYPSYKEVGDLA